MSREIKMPITLKLGDKRTSFGEEFTLVRVINHGILSENDGTPCEGNETPFIETICTDKDGLFYLCDCGMQPVDKGYVSIEEIAKVHGSLSYMNQLQELAIKLYNKEVLVPEWRENFLKNLNDGVPVFDMRKEGHYCSYCKKVSDEAVAFGANDKVIFVNNGILDTGLKQIWIVNSHYDGCRGWE